MLPTTDSKLIVISTKNEEKSFTNKQISHSYLIRNDSADAAFCHLHIVSNKIGLVLCLKVTVSGIELCYS